MEKKCLNCGKVFEPSHGAQKHCTPECRKQYNLTLKRRYDKDKSAKKSGKIVGEWERQMTPALERFIYRLVEVVKGVQKIENNRTIGRIDDAL